MFCPSSRRVFVNIQGLNLYPSFGKNDAQPVELMFVTLRLWETEQVAEVGFEPT
jgi:hypothetical protein